MITVPFSIFGQAHAHRFFECWVVEFHQQFGLDFFRVELEGYFAPELFADRLELARVEPLFRFGRRSLLLLVVPAQQIVEIAVQRLRFGPAIISLAFL